MADQDIQFKVTADVQDAKQGFEEVQGKIDGMTDSAKETVPVMGEASDAVKDVGNVADDVGGTVGGFSSLLGTGLVVAAAAAGIALIGLARDFLETDGEVENLTAKMKEHWSEVFKATQEWKAFEQQLKDMNLDEIAASLEGNLTRMADLSAKMAIDWYNILDAIGLIDASGELEILAKETALLLKVETKKNREDWERNMFGMSIQEMKDWFFAQKQTHKEAVDDTEAFYNRLKKLEEDYVKWLRDVEKNERTRLPYADRGKTNITGGRGKVKGGKEEAGMTQQFAEDMAFMDGLIMSSAGLLRSEFMQAWEDIFGEANSLLEKFIANIVAALADLAAQKMAMGIFGFFASLFTGGAASAVTAIASSPSSGTPIQNNIIIDGRQTAIIYTNGKMNASRLRMD